MLVPCKNDEFDFDIENISLTYYDAPSASMVEYGGYSGTNPQNCKWELQLNAATD